MFTHVVTLIGTLPPCPRCLELSYCLVSFHFSLKDSLYYFLECRSASNKFSQFLFTWESSFLFHFYFIIIVYYIN